MNWYSANGNGGTVPAGARGSDADAMNGNAVMYDAVAGKILTVGGAPSYQVRLQTLWQQTETWVRRHRKRLRILAVRCASVRPSEIMVTLLACDGRLSKPETQRL